MSEQFSTEMKIGGKIPGDAIPGLLKAIGNEALYLNWDGNEFQPQTVDDLLAAIGSDGLLHLTDPERDWGELIELEAFLQQNGIGFDKQVDARYEYDAELIRFRPGMTEPHIDNATATDFCPLVRHDQVKEARDLLRQSKPRAALTLLEEICGPDIPELERLEIVGDVPRSRP